MLALNRSATLAPWPFRNSPWHLGQDNLLTIFFSAANLTLQCRDYDTYRYTVILTLGLWQQRTSLRLVPKVITVTMIRVIHPHNNATRRWRASVSKLRWKTHWKRYRVTDVGPNRRHKLSLTGTDCVSVKFGRRNISIATLLLPRRLQLSCTRKLTGNIYPRCSLFLMRHFGFLKFFFNTTLLHSWRFGVSYSYTCVKAFSRGGKWYSATLNIEQGISTGEMPCACVELTRALLGQSAQAHSVNLNTHPYETWRFGLCRVIDSVTIEINSPNWQEIHWIREMLRQGMVVARQTTATYIEVVVQWCHLFLYSIRYAYRFFTSQKNEPKTESLYRCVRLTVYRYTRLYGQLSDVYLHKDSEKIRIKRGIRQRDTISPKLFTATLESIFRRLNWENKGVKIDGDFLSNLRFADDAQKHKNYNRCYVQELSDESRRMGLNMNIAKTKVMVVDNTPINVNNVLVENVHAYVYVVQHYSLKKKNPGGQRDTTKNHGRLGGIRQTPWYIFKRNLAICLKRQVYNSCVLQAMTWCRDLDTDQTSTEQTCCHTDQNGKKYAQHHMQRQKDQHLGQGEDKSHRYNQHCEKKWNGPGQGISTASKTTDGPRTSPLGDHMTRNDDKGDQPSGGETTWTNTGGTRYGRWQHKTG